MKKKIVEYLEQSLEIDDEIKSARMELEELYNIAASVGSIGLEEHYNPNRPTEAPFVRGLDNVWDMKERVNKRIETLLMLKKQIGEVIAGAKNRKERLVLEHRYIHCRTWVEVGDELGIDEKTARRRHDKAVSKLKLPDDAIFL